MLPRQRILASEPRTGRMAQIVGGAALLGCLALLFAACNPLPGSTPAQAGQYFPVIRTPTGSTTPTAGPLAYTVGAWPSDYAPAAQSSITIFVSFRHAGEPIARAVVTAEAYYPGSHSVFVGPVSTNGQGYAALPMRVGALASPSGKTNRTVQVTVTVTYLGSAYTATTNFTPL